MGAALSVVQLHWHLICLTARCCLVLWCICELAQAAEILSYSTPVHLIHALGTKRKYLHIHRGFMLAAQRDTLMCLCEFVLTCCLYLRVLQVGVGGDRPCAMGTIWLGMCCLRPDGHCQGTCLSLASDY